MDMKKLAPKTGLKKMTDCLPESERIKIQGRIDKKFMSNFKRYQQLRKAYQKTLEIASDPKQKNQLKDYLALRECEKSPF